MNIIKRYLGIAWLVAGPMIWILLVVTAIRYISGTEKGDISNPIPWLIIITIFTPIAIGFSIFGWYSWKGEFDEA